MQQAAGRVLLTGATGYIGGRLLRRLEASGRPVRCMVRRPEALSGRVAAQTEIVHGDILEPDSLHEALAGVTVAYYLIHSMAAPGPFAGADRHGAEDFAAAARESGVSRIVYLGGLGAEHDVSTHLESRHEVGRILRESGVQTIEFRASVVIGSGSASFEIVRSLVDRSPVLPIPRWVRSRTQPIAVEDVLAYLLAALDLELEESRLFEIGGPDRVAYADLMREYARQAGLRRALIRVPLATPRISGLWLTVVTPVYASIGRELIESLRNDTLVADGSARELFPICPRGFREAIERALANEDREFAETRWSDALSAHRGRNWGGVTLGRRAVASRTISVAASPEQTFAPIQRIGGKTGWYYANGFWRLRGLLDKLVGGVGLRRGRRDPVRLAVGDTLDFWRVEAFEQDRLLRLSAEMKTPGRIWLQFEVDGDQAGTTLRQTAIFDPHGLAGLAYWYTLYPVHHLIFEGMLRRIGQAVIASARSSVAGAVRDQRGLV
ncbi:MAG TPA: SDR family oxidoreductase [Gaiellaceae bacterium]